mgnify:CR=1 FL=1
MSNNFYLNDLLNEVVKKREICQQNIDINQDTWSNATLMFFKGKLNTLDSIVKLIEDKKSDLDRDHTLHNQLTDLTCMIDKMNKILE